MAITASSDPGEYVVFAQLLAELYHAANQECIAEKIFHIHGGDRVTYTHLNDDGDKIVFEIEWKQVQACIAALRSVWFDDRAIYIEGNYGKGSAFGERMFACWVHSVDYSGKTLTIRTGPQRPERCRITAEQTHRPKVHDLAARNLIDLTPFLRLDL